MLTSYKCMLPIDFINNWPQFKKSIKSLSNQSNYNVLLFDCCDWFDSFHKINERTEPYLRKYTSSQVQSWHQSQIRLWLAYQWMESNIQTPIKLVLTNCTRNIKFFSIASQPLLNTYIQFTEQSDSKNKSCYKPTSFVLYSL